ncbi:Plasma membrane sulfite pump involved in sulfite metabolism [Coemansia brasiliensis]|uniref:Plasma membrane sulfite pump involved in sulfite metabolism n=1 Tax=Coemansia brasiliensis TaxID=2650707 RepID=A0A9W8IH99_9FUNG|nr:Plasma membrane sulfite pump involved in sulfite metabolism [Coemansia brasiliensis]
MHSRATTDHSEITLGTSTFSPHSMRLDLIKSHIHRPMHKLDTRKDAIRGFSPAWFTASMGTGMVCVLLHGFPYSCQPLRYIAMGVGMLNLLMFLGFLALFTWRLAQYRDLNIILLHPQLSMPLGAIPMALATVISTIVAILTPYNLSWVPMLALVLWCIHLCLAIPMFLFIPFVAISHQTHKFELVNATLLLPVVTTVVASSVGATVAALFEGTIAVAVVLISYMLWAMGLGTSLMIITFYVIRLMLHKLPPSEIIASTFLPLGPLGQSSYGIQLLGSQAQRLLPGLLPQIQYLGDFLYCMGFFLGLALWALAIWWFTHALCSVVYRRIHGPVPFNLGWWAFIFPAGTFALSSNELWVTTGFTFFRVLASVVSAGIILMWIFVFSNTIRYGWTGELLKPINISRLELQKDPETTASTPIVQV